MTGIDLKRKLPHYGMPWLLIALLFLMTGSGGLRAQEVKGPKGFQAGVLELSGSTSFSFDYKNESGSGRERTHLRLTPSIGYFILDGFEVLLETSYIMDNLHRSAGDNDREHNFLFTIGPAYHFTRFSEVFVPYSALLIGMYWQKFSGESAGGGESHSDLQLALGMEAGIHWMVTENLGLKAGFQYIHGFKEEYIGSTDFLGLMVGASIFIPTWPAY